VNGDGVNLVIFKNSDAQYKKVGNIIYVGDKNVAIVQHPDTINQKATSLLRDTNAELQSTGEIVKLAYDAGEYYYNGKNYSLPGIVDKLLKEGYDKYSVYEITKTAAENGEAAMAAVSAKLDMLSNMVMNLAGKVEMLSQQAQGLSSLPAQEPIPQEAAPEQAPQIDAGASADIAAAAQQSAAEPQGIYAAQEPQAVEQPAMEQEPVPGDVPPQPQDTAGMNQNIDPMVLQTLAQLKDSKVMDIGVIGTLGIDEEMSTIVASYKDDILHGVSAMGRILFNMMVRREKLSEQYGDGKYKKLVSSLKNLFTKMSDLYVEITMMGFEANAQVEH
jgi:hypothetical protein